MVQPETGLQKFMRSKPAPYLGMILATVMGLLFIYSGLITACFGGIMVAILLYMVPKSMGADAKKLAVFGLIFFLIASAFAAYVVSQPMMLNHKGQHNENNFTDIEVTPFRGDSGTYTFTVTYTSDTEVMTLEYSEVTTVWTLAWGHDNTKTETASSSGGIYTFNVALESGKIYDFRFIYDKSGSAQSISSEFIGPITMSDSDLGMFCLKWNVYGMLVNVMAFFALILLFTYWMRKNLEKTRERLEREGRLYPIGYGRCKECHTIVLPGEVVCRKCGAYIDVPEEMRVRKVDFFECSECGKEVPSGADTCPACGAVFEGTEDAEPEQDRIPASQTFTCSECKKEVPADAEVCPHCGERFED